MEGASGGRSTLTQSISVLARSLGGHPRIASTGAAAVAALAALSMVWHPAENGGTVWLSASGSRWLPSSGDARWLPVYHRPQPAAPERDLGALGEMRLVLGGAPGAVVHLGGLNGIAVSGPAAPAPGLGAAPIQLPAPSAPASHPPVSSAPVSSSPGSSAAASNGSGSGHLQPEAAALPPADSPGGSGVQPPIPLGGASSSGSSGHPRSSPSSSSLAESTPAHFGQLSSHELELPAADSDLPGVVAPDPRSVSRRLPSRQPWHRHEKHDGGESPSDHS